MCVGSRMFSLCQKMNAVKVYCKRLNIEGFGNIQQQTMDALTALESVQTTLLTNPSYALFQEEQSAKGKWNFSQQLKKISLNRNRECDDLRMGM